MPVLGRAAGLGYWLGSGRYGWVGRDVSSCTCSTSSAVACFLLLSNSLMSPRSTCEGEASVGPQSLPSPSRVQRGCVCAPGSGLTSTKSTVRSFHRQTSRV